MVHVAVRAGYGVPTALDMSPRRLRAICVLVGADDERDLLHHAIAARVAQADQSGWKKFTERLGG